MRTFVPGQKDDEAADGRKHTDRPESKSVVIVLKMKDDPETGESEAGRAEDEPRKHANGHRRRASAASRCSRSRTIGPPA
jgi:hypothetical protein